MKIEDLILNRRVFLKGGLKGAGTLVGLPFLESIFYNKAYAQSLGGKILRFACFYHPNGVIQQRVGNNLDSYAFFPDRNSNQQFNLAESNLKAVQDLGLREYLTIVKGVRTPDGSGNAHMRGIAGFLTGQGLSNDRVSKVNASIDEVFLSRIAKEVQNTGLYMVGNPQLDNPLSGSNYNNALKNALCFTGNGGFRTPRNDYKNLFDQLFAGLNQPAAKKEVSKRDFLKLSVLDSVKESRDYLNSKVNKRDRVKLDTYYTRLREAERKISSMYDEKEIVAGTCKSQPNGISNLQNYNPNPTRNNVVHDVSDIIDNLNEMMAIAFACDRLRVFSFMFGGEAAGCEYRNLGVGRHFHNSLSHNNNQSNDTAKLHRRIDRYHIQKVAEFAKKLSELEDFGGKSVLDNTTILTGSGLARGYNHTHDPLPITILGKGGGGIKGGQFLELSGNDKPTGVLLSSILAAMGFPGVPMGSNTGARTFRLS